MIRTKMREAQLLRAAAYIRVSTSIEDQENSFDAQEKYFEELLAKSEQYESAGIYIPKKNIIVIVFYRKI